MKKDIPESLNRSILRLISNSWGENKEDHNCDVGLDIGQWWIQGRSPGGPGPPLIFRPNWWGLNGQKKMSWETTSLSKVSMTGPPLSQGLDPALSDTKIYHKVLQTLIIFEHIYNVMIFHKCFVIVPREW